MKKIVVFGGSFNPPLISHFSLAEGLLNEREDVEKIIFMPVSKAYSKAELIENEHRFNMLNLVCEKNPKFEVSNIELNYEVQLYTIETLYLIKQKYPDYEICFTIGTDNVKELETWKNAEDLLDKYKVFVFERGEDKLEDIIDNNNFLKKHEKSIVKLGNIVKTNLSSTYVRNLIKNKKSIKYLTEEEIINYIKRENLYA